jgi:hypothetical protein
MKFTPYLLLVFILFFTDVYSQTLLSGTIKNSVGNDLSGATVTVSKDSTGVILAYGISGTDGDFRIKLNSDVKTVFLKVSYIGYATWTKQIQKKDQKLELILTESSEELKEVMVEARNIQQRGDTLSYRVSAFKDQKDRVIADVLKKMPGIEIMPGGQIRYQGEPIGKYYINNLDLLEGRYSLANNNISADDVSEVQILENHQPVKVLDSLVFSEQASLNIKLKNDVTMTGTAEVGTGFSPLLWKAKLTPMIFTKKQQAILTYQANNIGKDVSREIRDFSFSDFGREEFDISKRDWLGIRGISPPPFEQERWLDNNVHLGSVNYLVRLKKDMDLKTNISYLNDHQQQAGNTQTRFFTPTDTIDLVENTRNELFINTLQSKFILERNTDDNYFKNELEINGNWDSQRGNIVTQDVAIQQRLSNPFSVIRNKLRLLKPVGKQLVTFRSNTGYTEANQSLNVNPGQFIELLNQGEPYAETEQTLSSSTLFTDNSAGFTKAIKGVTVAPEVGFALRKQQLDSRLGVIDEGTTTYPDGDFRNRMDFLSSRFYFTNRISYKKGDWNIRLLTPVSYRNFDIEDAFLGEDRRLSKLTFEPNLFINKKISAYWESSISANLSNDFSDFRSMYNGFILSNYRNIQRYNSPLPESFRQSYTGRVSYRNPLKSIFASAIYTYVVTENNLLYSNFIGNGGAIIFEAVEQENTSTSHILRLEGSKYFNRINTTLKLGSSYTLMQREQFLNNNLAEVDNQNLSLRLTLESEVTDWLSTSYNGNFSFLKTALDAAESNSIRSQQHLLDLFFFPAANQYFSIESEYYYTNLSRENRNSYFLNFEYQYTFEESRIDLAASWNNVLGTDEFVNVSSNEFSFVQSTYQLRPTQLLVSLKFVF